MLAKDIETLGFLSQKPLPPITCVCLHDGVTERTLLFYNLSTTSLEFECNRVKLIDLLDQAESLVGFDAVLHLLRSTNLLRNIKALKRTKQTGEVLERKIGLNARFL